MLRYDINSNGNKEEFYPTNEWIRDKLYELMPSVKPKKILDPCAGDGGLEFLNNNFYEYTLYDIKDYGIETEICDFLTRPHNDNEKFDAVVVNPPFKHTVEFIKKSFLYSDNVYAIAPIKTIFKEFGNYVENVFLSHEISRLFNINTGVGIFYLKKSSMFGKKFKTKEDLMKQYFLPKAEKTWEDIFKEVDTLEENKPFIVNKLYKSRLIRNEQLIHDEDIFEAGDDSAFIATGQNKFVKIGDRIKRRIKYFDTIEEAKRFQKAYNDNADYLREYCYQYGSTNLRLCEIPLLEY